MWPILGVLLSLAATTTIFLLIKEGIKGERKSSIMPILSRKYDSKDSFVYGFASFFG